MTQKLKETIYRLYLNEYTTREIAEKLNLSQSTVSRSIKKLKATIEHRMSKVVIEEFEQYFVKFQDAMSLDVMEITEQLQNESDPDRKIKLREQRHKRRLDIFKLVGDVRAVLMVRRMKDPPKTVPSTRVFDHFT